MTQIVPTEETLAGFAEFVQATMQEWQVPGLAIAIVKDDNVILSQGFGKRNLATDQEVTSETLFAIASCTKAFTATALGMLVDEGKLDWDTPVRQYLPSFQLYDSFASEHTTARDLLAHRTGLPRHDMTWYTDNSTREELFARLRYLKPTRVFREAWQYQNLMYMAAGYLLEAICGQRWEKFVRQRILEPLDMDSSNFSTSDSQKTDNYALPYRKIKDEVHEIDFYQDFGGIAPAGAINSSVAEMSQWLLLNLNKGKHGEEQLISEKQLEQISTPQMVLQEPRKYTELHYRSYAMGWSTNSYRGHLMVQHSGGIDGFSSLTTLFPDDKIGIVVLTNLSSCPAHGVVTYHAFEQLLGLSETPWSERYKKEVAEAKEAQKQTEQESTEKRVAGTQPSHELSAYTGSFEHPGYGKLQVSLDEDGLKITLHKVHFHLIHYHYDIFDTREEREEELVVKTSFITGVDGTVQALSIGLGLDPGLEPIVFTRVTG
jgi:CubicO group peptidase (beta-lactamase class C family)